MLVGRAGNRAGGCCEMLSMGARRALSMRGMQWLGRPHSQGQSDQEDLGVEGNVIVDLDPWAGEVQEANPASSSQEDEESGNEGNGPGGEDDASSSSDEEEVQHTRSGRAVKAPNRLIEEIDSATIQEIMAVGAGTGGGFEHTSELTPMKHDEAVNKDPIEWEKSVEKEHEHFVQHKVWKARHIKDSPAHAETLASDRKSVV